MHRDKPGLKRICLVKSKFQLMRIMECKHCRALENFQISGVKTNFYPDYVKAYAMVKLAAARANTEVGQNEERKNGCH